MALAYVTFINYYEYEVEIDDALYNEDPWAAEKQAIEDAYKQYETCKSCPLVDPYSDGVEVEFE